MTAGTAARLVEVADHTEMLALYRGIDSVRRESPVPGIVELVPGARTVLVEFDPKRLSAQEVDALILEVPLDRVDGDAVTVVEIEIAYDGADIDVVCDMLKFTRDEFAAWHSGRPWTVAFTGFAPGFGYLIRPDHKISVPRLEAPRTKVPAGAVAMAGAFTGLYPGESPGGWQLIGSTDHVLFDLDREPAAALLPGQQIRFVEAAP